jgi:putative ABC transport system permease protein
LYTRFYRFPVFGFQFDTAVVGLAFLVSAAAAVLGTVAAVRRAVRLPPAEAMRPEPPAVYRPTLMDRAGLSDFLPQAARMIFRELERKPIKALTSCFGISMAVAILVLGSFTIDAIDYIVDFQFYLSQRQDLIVTFNEPASAPAVYELQHLPGVLKCEPVRSAPTRFSFGHRSRRVAIVGLPARTQLFRLFDDRERLVTVPEEGLLLSSKLAELLHVRLGDTIRVEVLEGEQPVREVPVTALVTEYGGTNAYMDLRALHRLLREGDTVAGAFLMVDPRRLNELYTALKNTPKVAGVTVREASVRSFRDTIAENLGRIRLFNVMFASVIAFGVVYNSARISLAERSRDLATLRVIGFTRAEISAILLGELAVLTVAAIPAGLVLGFLFAAWATLGLDTEVYRIPLVVARSTYGFAASVVVVAAVISGLMVRQRVDHLDLIAVLKTRE